MNASIVALGGGHGLAVTLQALRRVTDQVTAVVTVADNGGSSGRLRDELGALPPGDLRMALAALASDGPDSGTWTELFQHRFTGSGALAGHAVGNLVLAGLAEVTGSAVTALDHAARLLGIHGRVLPLTLADVEIVATVAGRYPKQPDDLVEVRGQHQVASTLGQVRAVRLEPPDPPGCPEAVDAVLAAQHVVLGPGSLFTSVFPHLLVPDVRAAIVKTHAQRVFTLNLVPQPGETSGFSPRAHLAALAGLAPELRLDTVLADAGVLDRDGLMEAAAAFGATVRFAPVAADGNAARHDPDRLASAYADLFG